MKFIFFSSLTFFLLILQVFSHVSFHKKHLAPKPKEESEKKPKEIEILPGISNMVFGYNMFLGYPIPMNSVIDPGVSENAIFDLSFDLKKNLGGNYLVPDTIDVTTTSICSQSMASQEIRNEEEFADSLSGSVSVSAGYGLFANFKGSTEYAQNVKEFKNSKNVMIISKATCSFYSASFYSKAPTRLHPDFSETVKELVKSNNIKDYVKFIDHFGTHYVKHAVMGAKLIDQFTTSELELKTMKENKIDISATVSAGFWSVSAEASAAYKKSNEDKKTLNQKIENHKTNTYGSLPETKDIQKWHEHMKINPFPIQIKLNTFRKIFKQNYFPTLKQQDLDHAYTNLKKAIKTYCFAKSLLCAESEGVTHFSTDNWERIDDEKVKKNPKINSCNGFFTGFKSFQSGKIKITKYENSSKLDSTFYESNSYIKAIYANNMDSTSVEYVSVASPPTGWATTYARCPMGFVVSNCFASSMDSSSESFYPSYFPVNKGKACRCYSKNYECQAICLRKFSNMQFKIVKNQSDNGEEVTAYCPAGMKILGVGYRYGKNIQDLEMPDEKIQTFDKPLDVGLGIAQAYVDIKNAIGTVYAFCGKDIN